MSLLLSALFSLAAGYLGGLVALRGFVQWLESDDDPFESDDHNTPTLA